MKAMARTLPPSVLIRRKAPKGQVMHALVYLAERVGARRPRLAVAMLKHDGPVHLWAEYLDRGALEASLQMFIAAVEKFEALVGWTEERMPWARSERGSQEPWTRP